MIENTEKGVPKSERKNKGGRPKKVVHTAAIEPNNDAIAVSNEVVDLALLKRERRKKSTFKRGTRVPDVPKIPGYFTYWAEDGNSHKAGNIRALTVDDDYEFVHPSEVDYRDAEDNLVQGSRVTVQSGINEFGQTMTLYLLKKRLDWYYEDKGKEAIRNNSKVHDAKNSLPQVGPEDPKDPKSVNEYLEAMTYGRPEVINSFKQR